MGKCKKSIKFSRCGEKADFVEKNEKSRAFWNEKLDFSEKLLYNIRM
jgi:hypothetical protein